MVDAGAVSGGRGLVVCACVAQYAIRVARSTMNRGLIIRGSSSSTGLPLREGVLKVGSRCASRGPQVSLRPAAACAVIRASRVLSVKRLLKSTRGSSVRTGEARLLRRKSQRSVMTGEDMSDWHETNPNKPNNPSSTKIISITVINLTTLATLLTITTLISHE